MRRCVARSQEVDQALFVFFFSSSFLPHLGSNYFVLLRDGKSRPHALGAPEEVLIGDQSLPVRTGSTRPVRLFAASMKQRSTIQTIITVTAVMAMMMIFTALPGYCISHHCCSTVAGSREDYTAPPPSPPSSSSLPPCLPAFLLTLQLYDCSNALQMKRGANPPQIIDKSSPRGAGMKKKKRRRGEAREKRRGGRRKKEIPRQTDSLCALGQPFKELQC